MVEHQDADGLLKTWILAVVVLGTCAFVAQFFIPKFEAVFASAGTDVSLLTDVARASPDFVWILPVLALAGYLLRRRQVGSDGVHAAGAIGVLGIGACWLVVAVFGLLLPVL